MIILVDAGWSGVKNHIITNSCGYLVNPMGSLNLNETILNRERPWACDNGAYSNFNPKRFIKMITKVSKLDGCLFVSCPDQLADHISTAHLFDIWFPEIKKMGLPVAYVLQDRTISDEVPWNLIKAVFVGGTTHWKMGRSVRILIETARAKEKWIHMGRVSTEKRVSYASSLGVDSIDGSACSRFPERLKQTIKWVEFYNRNPYITLDCWK